MKKFFGFSLAIGILAGLVAYICSLIGVPSWMVYLGWSVSFFTGANWDGVKQSFPCMILGPILAMGTNFVIGQFGLGVLGAALVVVVLGFLMTYSQTFDIFPVTAAVFVSANIYFAHNDLFLAILLPILGLILGPTSMVFGNWLQGLMFGEE